MSEKRTMMFGKVVIVFSVMVALLFPGSATAASREKIKILYASFLDFLMDVPIAIEKGYFDALGLDLEAVDIPSNPTRTSLLPQEDINGAFLPSETALTLIDKGLGLVMVSGIGNRTFDFAVLSKSPVKSLKDFEGKTIASVPKPSNPRLALEYDPQATLSGKVKPTRSPLTYWNRIRLKHWFRRNVNAMITRERILRGRNESTFQVETGCPDRGLGPGMA